MYYVGTYIANNQEYDFVVTTNVDIPVGNFVNGICPAPASWLNLAQMPSYPQASWWDYSFYLQSVDASGNVSGGSFLFDGLEQSWLWGPDAFYDGRVQLKQNLIFQLREAPEDTAFHFWLGPTYYGDPGTFGAYTGDYDYPTNYVCSGLFPFYPFQTWTIDPYLPFEENCLFRDFVFSPADTDQNGYLTTGAYDDTYFGLGLTPPLTYQFQTNGMALPNLLAANESRWLLYEADGWIGNNFVGNVVDAGIVNEDSDWNTYCTLSMPGNVRNWFGLPYISANVVYMDYNNGISLATNVLYVGAPLTFTGDNIYGLNNSTIYPETAQPQFQTVEYDFWNPNTGYWDASLNWHSFEPLPGQDGFSPANTSGAMITSVGIPVVNSYGGFNSYFAVAGYAKLAVLNGYPGVYAYLGQYFDRAYQMDSNGNVTTNTTGILSPYGRFFATEPGPVALVTMPDPDTGARGTCTVYCVSLALNKSHNGGMDLSWNGSDATSANSPIPSGATIISTGGMM